MTLSQCARWGNCLVKNGTGDHPGEAPARKSTEWGVGQLVPSACSEGDQHVPLVSFSHVTPLLLLPRWRDTVSRVSDRRL